MPDLRVIVPYVEECRASVIDVLEKALAQARAGEIDAVAVAVVKRGGAINSERSKSDDVGRLLGSMALCQARMAQDIIA